MGISRGTLLLDDKWTQKNAIALSERIRLLEQHINDLEQTPHAHAYANNLNQLISIAATATPVDIDGYTADHESGFIFENTKEFRSLITGHTIILYSIAFDPVSVGTQDFEFAIAINNVWQTTATMHLVAPVLAVNQVFNVSGNSTFEIRYDDTIKLQVQNLTNTNDITIQHINLTIFRIHF